jgi:DNA polymerase-3 subunit epsilon
MYLLGLDFETTGLDVTQDRIIEVGAVLWDTEIEAPIQMLNALVNSGVQVSQEITSLTGIRQADVDKFGIQPLEALTLLADLMAESEVVVAHNGNGFDRPLLECECKRHNVELLDMHWIDTTLDVPYPESTKTRKLVHLAAEHGFINPFAHRALSDVLTMLKVLSHYDIQEVVRISKEPNITLVAQVKKPWEDAAPEGAKEVDKAKARGYRFNGGNKKWLKTVKQSDIQKERVHGEFIVTEMEA